MKAHWFSSLDITRKPFNILFPRARRRLFIDDLLASRLYYINCYSCGSSLILTFRHYPQSPRRIILPRPQRILFDYLLIIIIAKSLLQDRYQTFQGSFETSVPKQWPRVQQPKSLSQTPIPKQCPRTQRSISLSQFINCLKRFHEVLQ